MLLLDEITVDLDVLARADLLQFLKDESVERGLTIVYVGTLCHHPASSAHGARTFLHEDNYVPLLHPLLLLTSPGCWQATHIFDGLEGWPTHIMLLSDSRLKVFERAEHIPELQQEGLLHLVDG